MPGWPNLTEADYGASLGYATPSDSYGPTHTSFVVWTIVLALVAIGILGGLSVAGFSFLFHR